MQFTDGTLAVATLGVTVGTCLAARQLRSVKAWLPSTIQFLSGLVIPPLLAWLAFEFRSGIEGTHNSGSFLLLVWFVCIVAGMLFSRRTDRQAEGKNEA